MEHQVTAAFEKSESFLDHKEGVLALPHQTFPEISLALNRFPKLLGLVSLRFVHKQPAATLVLLLKVDELALLLIRKRTLRNFIVS